MVSIMPGNRARSRVQRSSITPPLRGSRRDKGTARSRSGGGQTRRRERATPAVDPEGGQRHLAGITTLPGNKSCLLKNFAKGSFNNVPNLRLLPAEFCKRLINLLVFIRVHSWFVVFLGGYLFSVLRGCGCWITPRLISGKPSRRPHVGRIIRERNRGHSWPVGNRPMFR